MTIIVRNISVTHKNYLQKYTNCRHIFNYQKAVGSVLITFRRIFVLRYYFMYNICVVRKKILAIVCENSIKIHFHRHGNWPLPTLRSLWAGILESLLGTSLGAMVTAKQHATQVHSFQPRTKALIENRETTIKLTLNSCWGLLTCYKGTSDG